MVLNFKYGLWFSKRLFVWHQKKLYRYPFNDGNRYYGLKEIEPKQNKYRLCREWVTIAKIKALTTAVTVEPITTLPQHEDLPF